MSEDASSQAHADRVAEMVERRVQAAAASIQQQFIGITQLIDQQLTSYKTHSDLAIESVSAAGREADAALRELLAERFAALEKARGLQALEYERRLSQLNHEHQRIADMQNTFVRLDTNSKDWDRLREERHTEAQAVAAAKLVQETAADTARRNTTLALISAVIALLSVGVSIFLHFSPV